MNKRMRLVLIVGALAVAGYLAFRWYEKKKASGNPAEQSPTGSLGANLNSVAPELVGGSTGPSVGPVLSSPVSITLNNTSTDTAPEEPGADEQEGVNHTYPGNPMKRQRTHASHQGTQPRSPGVDVDDAGGGSVPSPYTGGTEPGPKRGIPPVAVKKKGQPKTMATAPPAKRTTTPMKQE